MALAATAFTERFRCDLEKGQLRCFEVTSDGTSTTIDASSLDLAWIYSVMVAQKAALTGSSTWNPASISDGNEEATATWTVTGAALGDIVRASFSLDVTDLQLDAQVSSGNTITAVLANSTGGAINLGSGTVKAEVPKDIGFSTISGKYIVFAPALTSGDVFTIWAVGF